MNNFVLYSQGNEQNEKILDLDEYNGRVNIMQPPNQNLKFQMMEKVSIDNRATDFRDPLVGDQENNLLSNLFFSAENIQIIQNGMRAGVYELSNGKYIIPNQNIDNLKIIMKSIYLQYSENKPMNITQQIEVLNKLVLDYCVKSVYGEAVAYEKYCYDQSTIANPLERQNNYDRNFKQLELKPFV